MFADLNVPWPTGPAVGSSPESDQAAKRIVDVLADFGYGIVALNYTIEGRLPQTLANPIKPVNGESAKRPFQLDSLATQKPDSAARRPRIYQLSRLTVVSEDLSHTHGFNNNAAFSQFDILSIQPQTEKMFQQACSTLEVDIITLDMTSRLPFNLKHTTVGLAIARGVHFEITYSSSLRDANARRYLLSNAANLVRVTRGKNIIVSSQAQKALEVRGPYDVANLCTLFGMNQALGKQAISTNARSVVLHAHTRRNTYKGAVSISGSDMDT
ncbi:ribonuclease P/MRP protein subunit RPP1 [Hyaloraphidium curvatum]|nr:ribonuclease P/MRP protein subunit RPP1 [Hyaloraphidium curvatum]